MGKLLFTFVLVITAGVIFILTGKNRRQIDKIPIGMTIVCQPPGRRYVLYALGAIAVGIVMIFSVFYIMDDNAKEAGMMWEICIIVAMLTFFIMIFAGNVMAKECIYFNDQTIQIEKAFHKSRLIKWDDIRKMSGSFDNTIHLYLANDSKILTVNIGMVNYEVFCVALKKKCPKIVKDFYFVQSERKFQKGVLRVGSEYYVIAFMGILILLIYLALLASSDDGDLLQKMLESDPANWFSVWFAPVCGIVSLVFLWIISNTKIQYDQEKMILQFPLRRKKEILWRNIQRIETVTIAKSGVRIWKKVKIYTNDQKYQIHLEFLTHGKDCFQTEVLKMIQKYEISCSPNTVL